MSSPNFEIGPSDRDLYLKAGGVPRLKLSADGALSAINGGSIASALLTAPWSTRPFAASDYTGNGAMTVTVGAADVDTDSYLVLGKLLIWRLRLTNLSIGGTLNTQVRVALPAGLVGADLTAGVCHVVNNGTGGFGVWEVPDAGTFVRFMVAVPPVNWLASTNNSAIRALLLIGIG